MSKESNNENKKFLYDYYIRSMVAFFSDNNSKITSRYVLYFDSLDNIIAFEQQMKDRLSDEGELSEMQKRLGRPNLNVRVMSPYVIENDEGEVEYEATQIQFADGEYSQMVVFIPDCDSDKVQLGDAFKNGIRNKFVDNQETKILFYLSVQNIASVSKTTENFQRTGMPLSVSNVYEDLRVKISNVEGDKQRQTLLFSLKKIMENKVQTDMTLTDFAPIIKIIEKRKLVEDDFHDLHLFRMNVSDLGKKDEKLSENYRLFRDLGIAIEDQEVESCLSKYESSLAGKIKNLYEKYGDEWDYQISFEEIQKNKKENQKKFKVEAIDIKDVNGCDIEQRFYMLRPSEGTLIFFTKDYPEEKQFFVELRCTQKPTVDSHDFDTEYMNSRGTIVRVKVDRAEDYYTGSVLLVGGRAKKKFSLNIIVMNTTSAFLPEGFSGIKKDKFIFNFEAKDYRLQLGAGSAVPPLEVECAKLCEVPLPIRSTNETQVIFHCPEDESLNEYEISFLLDDDFVMQSKIHFEEQSLKLIEAYELFNKCNVWKNTYSVNDEIIFNIHQRNEKYKTDEFTVGGTTYQTSMLLKIEHDMIVGKCLYATSNSIQNLQEKECLVPADVKQAYMNICEYFTSMGSTPSLAPYTQRVEELYRIYVSTVLEHIGAESPEFRDKEPLKESVYALMHLGVIEDTDGFIWLSPLHPLSVCYQMELHEKQNLITELDAELFSCMGYGNLMPFMYGKDGAVFQAIKGNYPLQWACYYDSAESVKGDKKTYYEKIKDYYSKFSYLFNDVANNTFMINLIGIHHTGELIDAILMLYEANPKFREIPMEVHYYYKGIGRNEFDSMTSPEYVRNKACKAFAKKNQHLVDEFCDWYLEKFFYYANPDNESYNYAHITFCAIQTESQKSKKNTISKAKSGIMLEGVISDIPSCLDSESGFYKFGFGAEYVHDILGDNELFKTVNAYNELANCEEGSPVSRDSSIALAVQNTKSSKLKTIYEVSNWVVFIEPKIDLDFFIKQEEGKDDLIIIHYPDKNVTSSGYSSITVTKKTAQYINVIKTYLGNKLSKEIQEADVRAIIKNYNAYSGEWLMTFIKNYTLRTDEKISLVSAIRFCLEYFKKLRPEYVWVPLALDEILRVTGAIGGNLADCLFSKKVLIDRGIIDRQDKNSDDLLMAGLRMEEDGIAVTYIPVEVKHGNVGAEMKAKAHEQSRNTATLLRQTFIDEENEGTRIDKKIYRNFMMQHVLSNIEKMAAYEIVSPDSEYQNVVNSSARVKLMNDNYTLELPQDENIYAFYFMEGKDVVDHKRNITDNVVEITAPISCMYKYLLDIQDIENTVDALVETEMAIDDAQYEVDEDAEEYEYDDDEEVEADIPETMDSDEETDANVEKADLESSDKKHSNSWEESRVLIGTDASQTPVFWEFGHKNLANRHLLITGTSGQGKTYSIQTMLYELAKVNVPAVIFDYTEGFRRDQLEDEFVAGMDGKIKERFFYYEGVPINPFVRHDIDLGSLVIKEKATDVASRLADVFSHVYEFGDQQYSAIFSAALNGINTYGENMNMSALRSELEAVGETNKAAKTVISKMEPFFQSITFENGNDFDWGEILYGEAAVNIFQLTAINREMQVIITELMLWDAWHYTKKYGNKNKPFVVVLDEAQNLSHKKNSPSAAILTEGRKFGWSAWFATQSLKILRDEEVVRLLQAAFKLYFKPTDDEIVKIAKQLDPTGDVNWAAEVKGLKKGQCIVVGDRVKSNGVFGGTQPVKVSVTPFEKRLEAEEDRW